MAANKPNRMVLRMAVAALCKQFGFDNAQESVVETLTEMIQSYITEVGKSAKAVCELAGRTRVMPGDVTLALMEMGLNISALPTFFQRRENGRVIIAPPQNPQLPHESRSVRVGNVRPHPSHIPDYLPQFPDPHTYIRTPIQVEFSCDYETSRVRCAEQQRNLETSLVKLIQDVDPGRCIKVFVADSEYSVILSRRQSNAYLTALLPRNEDSLETETEEQGAPDAKSVDNPFLRPIKMPQNVEKS